MRHNAAPKGSSITAYNPPFKNSEDAPNTVSEPNHVAKSAEELSNKGKLLPAKRKSPDVLILRDAQ